MFYSSINTDFAAYQTKVAFGLTKRQIICFLLATMLGLPTYFFTKEYLGTDVSGILMIIVMVPFFAFAMYKKNGQTLETVLKHYIKEQYFSSISFILYSSSKSFSSSEIFIITDVPRSSFSHGKVSYSPSLSQTHLTAGAPVYDFVSIVTVSDTIKDE